MPVSRVPAARDGDKKKGSVDTAELLDCERQAHKEDDLKGSLHEQPIDNDCDTDVCLQVELLCTTAHRDASCECDIQPGSSRDPALLLESTDACTQTEDRGGECIGLGPCGVMSAAEEGHGAVQGSGARDATADDKCGSIVQRKEVAVQASDPLMPTLRVQLSVLEAELALAQSTVIWQSVMLRCLNYQ